MRSKQLYIKRAIEASFLKLLDEHPFEKITVKNIVDDCGLTRNTFYNYFEDTYDVVEGLLRAQMCRLVHYTEDGESETLSLAQAMEPVSRFAREHPRAVRHLFRSSKREEIVRYFYQVLKVTVSHLVDGVIGERCVREADRALIVDACLFITAGFLQKWMEADMQGSVEDTLAEVDSLFSTAVHDAVDRAVARGEQRKG